MPPTVYFHELSFCKMGHIRRAAIEPTRNKSEEIDEFASRAASFTVQRHRGALITMQIHLSAALMTTKSSKSQTRWPAAFSGADGRRTTNQQQLQLLRHPSNKNRTSGVTDCERCALPALSRCSPGEAEASLIIFCTDGTGDVNSLPRHVRISIREIERALSLQENPAENYWHAVILEYI